MSDAILIADQLDGRLTQLLGRPGWFVETLPGGGNNQLFRVRDSEGTDYVLKSYFRSVDDPRDRLEVEFTALRLMWEGGARNVPQPISSDPERGFAIYEFIVGTKVLPGQQKDSDITAAVELLASLKRAAQEEGQGYPYVASEACFSLDALKANLDERLGRLKALTVSNELYDQLTTFLRTELVPGFHSLFASSQQKFSRLGTPSEQELSRSRRTLSPSDFGFHNALRRLDGSLCFLDFEYFGWDDSAKTICDFLLHPAMSLTEQQTQAFLASAFQCFDDHPRLPERVEALYPLYGLKWCCILLNQFVPEFAHRRRFAHHPLAETQVALQVQLSRARQLLQAILAWNGDFATAVKTTHTSSLDRRSRALRVEIVKTLEHGRRGHVGSAFSLVEILRVLYDDVLRYDPKTPRWPGRDRCILSKGHGCLALYVLLAEKGFFDSTELDKFCQEDGILGGHPESGKVPGVEASTGSLGHGLSIGIGMALNARFERANYRTFVIIGDGETNEGSVWEAALCAGKYGLSHLTVIVDYNKQQSYDSTYVVQDLEPMTDKWRSFGFAVQEVDGHSVEDLRTTLRKLPFESGKPNALICHTVKGKGVPFTENNPEWHHKNKVTDDELLALYRALRT